MNRKLTRTTGHIVRKELRTLVDSGAIRDARVRVSRIGSCCRCKITSHTTDGSPLVVEAVAATRARAVRMAVQRLRDRVRDLLGSSNPFRKESTNEHHHNKDERERCYVGHLPRRRHRPRFHALEDGCAVLP